MDLADHTSDSSKEFKELVSQMMVEAGKLNLADYFPLLKRLDPQGVKRRMNGNGRRILNVYGTIIKNRQQDREVSGVVSKNDMLETFLDLSEHKEKGLDIVQIEHFFWSVCSPEFHLVGARMRAPIQRGLGLSTLPGTRRTHVRMSRHLPFYDPKVENRQVNRV
ncbi:hypothetical protein CDL15_Pgr017812 [Punica granatum]|uniref:Uncharacterized protein n=1 Tax=Punica granatum TaxID=22663 RepID=A0A218WHG9_PUNGR|nr:hypothetical protein CDL15_Pgr017812 [Punica granatum]PKI32757.1 hypothetical protein CRG98_046853 [Punica granatum]